MSWRTQVLGRKAGNKRHCLFRLALQRDSCIGLREERALAGSTFGKQIWYYAGSLWSQERKQRRRFPLIMAILLTACSPPPPPRDLLDFPTPRTEAARQCGQPQQNPTCCWPAPSTPSTRFPSAGSPKAIMKIILRATGPLYIWVSLLPFPPLGTEPHLLL